MDQQRDSAVLLRETHEGICTLTLNRPQSMNALDGPLLAQLLRTCQEIRHDNSIRVVILTGSDGAAFCAGADLKERRGMDELAVKQRLDDYRTCFDALASLPKPTICAINGYAFGGGLELALACDLRVVAEDTQIGLTELRLGIIPGAGGTQRLARLVGVARAKELIFTGARVKGTRAAELGIANYAVASEEVLRLSLKLAREMLLSAPIALRQAKLAIDTGLQVDLQSGLTIEAIAYAVTLPTKDRLEGLAAFGEKRNPQFEGK
ncbi:MAG: enoyl-CoA hydratase/isomerase family protein [Bradymonadaceae bacterium]|nr:enoyl-CoA hydratase/isomerase family protein [Lujinxingiaceae bacterium]